MELAIKIKAFDANLIDSAVKRVVEACKIAKVTISGPIPLPTKREVFTVLRATHINKTAREQFESRTHKRLIVLDNVDEKFFESIKKLELPAGAKIEVALR